MRTIIDIPDDQLARLEEYCQREHLSRAAAVRMAIQALLERQRREEHERVVNEAFGAWSHYGVSTDDYLEEIRREWEH